MLFDDLSVAVSEAVAQAGTSVRGGLDTLLSSVLKSPRVREHIEWELPRIDDLTDDLGVSSGHVLAIRYDSLGSAVGLKKPVVAALLVRYLIGHRPSRVPIKGFVDGGNVNTGLALGYFAERFQFEARLVVSRFFPDDVRQYLQDTAKGRLRVIAAPPSHMGREREFYSYLLHLVRTRAIPGFACLWHAKHGGAALRPLGSELAAKVNRCPDDIVLSIGAGTTLEGFALPIQEKFGMAPRIVVAEHEVCPLLRVPPNAVSRVESALPDHFATDWLRPPPNGIPHFVAGPHYDEVNPLLRSSVLQRVGAVVRYGEDQWKQMAAYCRSQGFSIGNSSAVNLLVARSLAEQGRSVMTFIYEPRRAYYEAATGEDRSNMGTRRHRSSLKTEALAKEFVCREEGTQCPQTMGERASPGRR